MKENNSQQPVCKTTIGGQALIEGLLMIGPEKRAMAVRQADGNIFVEELPLSKSSSKVAEIPFLRGSVRLFRQLVTGTGALMRSAELSEEPEVEETSVVGAMSLASDGQALNTEPIVSAGQTPSTEPVEKPRKSAIDRFFDRHLNLLLYGSVVLGLLFSVGLFILLPNFITSLLNQFTGLGDLTGGGAQIARNLIEGVFRIVIFIGYLYFASRLKDIQRVWQYHGAEHKTIACYEAGKELTVENARGYSRLHPRCGTAFMFIVIIVSIITFSLIGWHGRWLNLLLRLALTPVVAGIAYEIIRLAGRYDNALTRAVSKPGLLLQHLTTAEPDDGMLEVAIAAMNAVRPQSAGTQDKW